MHRVAVNNFRMGEGKFYRSFIIKVDYLFYYIEFLTEIYFSIIVFSSVWTDMFGYYIAG